MCQSFVNNSRNSPLLKLPAEIWITIYLYVLEDRNSVFVCVRQKEDMDCTHCDLGVNALSRLNSPKFFQRECQLDKAQQWALMRVCRQIRFNVLSLALSQDNYRVHNISCLPELSAAEKAGIKTLLVRSEIDPFSCFTCYLLWGINNLDVARFLPNVKGVTLQVKNLPRMLCPHRRTRSVYRERPEQLETHVRRALALEQRRDVTVRLEVQSVRKNGETTVYAWDR